MKTPLERLENEDGSRVLLLSPDGIELQAQGSTRMRLGFGEGDAPQIEILNANEDVVLRCALTHGEPEITLRSIERHDVASLYVGDPEYGSGLEIVHDPDSGSEQAPVRVALQVQSDQNIAGLACRSEPFYAGLSTEPNGAFCFLLHDGDSAERLSLINTGEEQSLNVSHGESGVAGLRASKTHTDVYLVDPTSTRYVSLLAAEDSVTIGVWEDEQSTEARAVLGVVEDIATYSVTTGPFFVAAEVSSTGCAIRMQDTQHREITTAE